MSLCRWEANKSDRVSEAMDFWSLSGNDGGEGKRESSGWMVGQPAGKNDEDQAGGGCWDVGTLGASEGVEERGWIVLRESERDSRGGDFSIDWR